MNSKFFSREDFFTQSNVIIETSGILDNGDKQLFDTCLLPSYLGARLCYTTKHPFSIIEEFKNKDKVFRLLKRLHNLGHYSVFAHSPLFNINKFNYNVVYNSQLRDMYKVYSDHNRKLSILNLRHILEHASNTTLSDKRIESIFENAYTNDTKILQNTITIKRVIFESNGNIILKTENRLADFFNNNNKIGAVDDITKLVVNDMFELILIDYSSVTQPFGWICAIFNGCSVIMTHQLVRHTMFNFNQRSYRYTKPSINTINLYSFKELTTKKVFGTILEIINSSFNLYDYLINNISSIKREEARRILPWGQPTTIIASAPLFVFQDFISKRIIEQSQSEINTFAKVLSNVIYQEK